MSDPARDLDAERTREAEELDQTRMSFGDHLEELRKRVMISLVAVVVAMIASFAFETKLKEFVAGPYEGVRESLLNDKDKPRDIGKLTHFGITEPFVVSLKLTFIAGLAFGGPIVIYQIWQFVAAGLYKRERRAVMFYFPLGIGLFAAGLAFGFYVMLPIAIDFLMGWDDVSEFQINWSLYLSFVFWLTFAVGLVFQLPLIMLFLSRMGIVEPKTYRTKRKICIFLAFVIGALLTPPDPSTQIMMAGSIIVLFEVGIILATFGWRQRQLPDDDEIDASPAGA